MLSTVETPPLLSSASFLGGSGPPFAAAVGVVKVVEKLLLRVWSTRLAPCMPAGNGE